MKGFNSRILVTIVIMLLIPFILFSLGRAKVKISDDPLSEGIVERWGAALPAGFTKESVEHIADGKGYNFAKLHFEKEISDILAKWEVPDETVKTAFDAVIDAQLADEKTSAEDAAFIEQNRPDWSLEYKAFMLTDEEKPGARLLLCYQVQMQTMIVAEEQK